MMGYIFALYQHMENFRKKRKKKIIDLILFEHDHQTVEIR